VNFRTIGLRVNIADETECPNTSVELVVCKLKKQEDHQIAARFARTIASTWGGMVSNGLLLRR